VKFEKALEQFPENKNIEVVYKSFQLMPDIVTNKDQSVYQLLSEVKGIPMDQVLVMHGQLTQAAKEIGLEYNFDKTIVANTYKAHQFIHFSKKVGKQNEAIKVLFQAYFTDGKNIDDLSTLIQLAKEIGLDTVSLKIDLENNNFANEVNEDIQEARQIGVRGVPFFVFDRKYAVSGAQDPTVFLETLKKSYSEFQED
jgi:protein disulfide-isomerase